MKQKKLIILLVVFVLLLGVILVIYQYRNQNKESVPVNQLEHFTKNSTIGDVIYNDSFKDFGRLLFPVD